MTRTRAATRHDQCGLRNDTRVILDHARATAPTPGIGALSAAPSQKGIDMSGRPAQTVGRRFNHQHERGRPTSFTRATAPSDGSGALLELWGGVGICSAFADPVEQLAATSRRIR